MRLLRRWLRSGLRWVLMLDEDGRPVRVEGEPESEDWVVPFPLACRVNGCVAHRRGRR